MSESKESWRTKCQDSLKGIDKKLTSAIKRYLCGIAGVIAGGIALFVAFAALRGVEHYEADMVAAVAAVLTLPAAIYGLCLLNKRTITAEKQTKEIEKQTKNTAKQIKEGRFAKAFEQIGSENVAIRLGGLELLDALAREGEEEYQRVWDYLARFLRQPPPLPLSDVKKGAPIGQRADIAEIAKMLREAHGRYPSHNTKTLDLSEAWLEGADLSKAGLEGADLSKAGLERAKLFGTELEGAGLAGAGLEGANLSEAGLERVILFEARLEGANLSKAWLEGADLSKAGLEGAKLFSAQLGGANLIEARLEGANLQAAAFENCLLMDTVFNKTNVSFCDFSQAQNLTEGQLKGMVYIKGQKAPKFHYSMSHQEIRCITEEEWETIKKTFVRGGGHHKHQAVK